MRKGKIKDAKRLLNSNTNSTKPLKTSDVLNGKTVMDILLEKHLEGAPLHHNAISPAEQHHHNFHPIIFKTIDGTLVRVAQQGHQALMPAIGGEFEHPMVTTPTTYVRLLQQSQDASARNTWTLTQ